jgi:hypothetical protein
MPDKEETEFVQVDVLKNTEWSNEFERYMRNRLIVGAYRYGRLGAKGKPKYDCVGAIKARVQKYSETGNLDLLVDVANLALIEFVEGKHPSKHMEAESHRDTVEVVT